MDNLTWDLCDFIKDEDRRILEEAIFEAFGLQKAKGDASPNFEELMNRFDLMAYYYIDQNVVKAKDSVRWQGLHIALAGLRKLIICKCLEVRGKIGPYDKIVSILNDNDTIVSFNWDVLLELAFIRAEKNYTYLANINKKSNITLMLKPHGSINWFALLDRELLIIDNEGGNVEVIGDLSNYMLSLKDPLGSVDMGRSSEFARLNVSDVPAIVPPNSAKLLNVGDYARDSFVRNGHGNFMSKIWKKFDESLSNADEIYVIGYSLPGGDTTSIEVMKKVRNRKDIKLFIIDKNPRMVERYRTIVHQNSELLSQDFADINNLI